MKKHYLKERPIRVLYEHTFTLYNKEGDEEEVTNDFLNILLRSLAKRIFYRTQNKIIPMEFPHVFTHVLIEKKAMGATCDKMELELESIAVHMLTIDNPGM